MEAENLQASSETGKMYIELRIVDFWIRMLDRTQTSLRKAFPLLYRLFEPILTIQSSIAHIYLAIRLWLNYDSP